MRVLYNLRMNGIGTNRNKYYSVRPSEKGVFHTKLHCLERPVERTCQRITEFWVCRVRLLRCAAKVSHGSAEFVPKHNLPCISLCAEPSTFAAENSCLLERLKQVQSARINAAITCRVGFQTAHCLREKQPMPVLYLWPCTVTIECKFYICTLRIRFQ